MNKAKIRSCTFLETAFLFLAAVIIAVTALNTGILTEPGKILPTGLSMRSGEMSENIIRGLDLAAEDIRLIRSGNASSDIWRLLTFVHVDLFFYLVLILPETLTKAVLLAGYFVRFGLCCASMYYFLSGHLKLTRLFSALLALMYAFSSQIVYTAQFAAVMNMAIMIPLVMSAFDSYLRKRTWRAFVFVSLASFGLAVSGGFGVITGIPVMVFVSLLMCISLYSTFKMAFTSWFKLLGGMISGLALSTVFVLPALLDMEFDVNIADSFKNAKVTYTLFDLIRGTFLLRSGGIYQNTAPLFYVGILTVIAVTAFALNERIPERIKVASAIIAAVLHITCCSSFVNETVSIYGAAPVLNSSRLICLEAIVFFVAGIGLKNIKWLTRGDYIASCLIPLFFLIISGSSTAGTSFASPIVISTFLGITGESVLVYSLAKNRISEKGKYAVLIAVTVFVGVNTAFMMFNNTMQKKSCEEYFSVDLSSGESVILDKDLELPLLSAGDRYLIVPSDLSSFKSGDSVIDGLNYVSEKDSGEQLFEEIYLKPSDKREMRQEGVDTFLLNGGVNVISFEPFVIEPGERIFVFCNAETGAAVDINSPDGGSGRAFTGPFLTEINTGPGEVTIRLNIDSEGEEKCRISIYKLNGTALDAVKSLSGIAGSSRFSVDVKDVNGICTLVLPYAYDDTKVTINENACETFGFFGKLAVTFNADNDVITVSVADRSAGVVPGALISISAALCLVAIPVFHMYNKKKEITREGTDINA